MSLDNETTGDDRPVATRKVPYSGDPDQNVQVVGLAAFSGPDDAKVPHDIGGDEANGLDVDVTRLPSLPAGNNNIGDVDVASLPPLPAGNNNIGDVDIQKVGTVVDAGNSTTTPLAQAATFTGTATDLLGYEAISVYGASNKYHEVFADFSADGTNWDFIERLGECENSTPVVASCPVRARYVRLRVVQDDVGADGFLRVQTLLHTHPAQVTVQGNFRPEQDSFNGEQAGARPVQVIPARGSTVDPANRAFAVAGWDGTDAKVLKTDDAGHPEPVHSQSAPATAAWTSATAPGAAVSLDISKYTTAVIAIARDSGSISAGGVEFEASYDGGASWASLIGSISTADDRQYAWNITFQGPNTARVFQFQVAAFTHLRARLSPTITGTATITITLLASTAPSAATDVAVDGLVSLTEPYNDLSAYSSGTRRVLVPGYIYDEVAGTAPTEDAIAAARIDGKRAQVFVFEDATTRGQRAAVSAAGRLSVDGSGVTQPVSIAATVQVDVTDEPGRDMGKVDIASLDQYTPVSGRLPVDGSGVTQPIQDSEKVADNAAFTDGTTKVQPAGFVYDEVAGTALTENDAAAARINANRAQVGVIEDGVTRGRYARVTLGLDGVNRLSVDVTPASGVGVVVAAAPSAPVSVRLSDGTTSLIGQKAMAASVPVVLASDQSAVLADLRRGQTILFASVSASSSGDNTVVAADGTKKIKVLSYTLVAVAAVDVKWKSGASTDLSGAMPFAAQGGTSSPVGTPAGGHLLETAVNQALVLNLSAATGVRGHISYYLEA